MDSPIPAGNCLDSSTNSNNDVIKISSWDGHANLDDDGDHELNLENYFSSMLMKTENVEESENEEDSKNNFTKEENIPGGKITESQSDDYYDDDDVEDNVDAVKSPRSPRAYDHTSQSILTEEVDDEVGDKVYFDNSGRIQINNVDDDMRFGSCSDGDVNDDEDIDDEEDCEGNGFENYVMRLAGEIDDSEELMDSLAGTLGELRSNFLDYGSNVHNGQFSGQSVGNSVSKELMDIMKDYESMLGTIGGKNNLKHQHHSHHVKGSTATGTGVKGKGNPSGTGTTATHSRDKPSNGDKPVKKTRRDSKTKKEQSQQSQSQSVKDEKKGIKVVHVPERPIFPLIDADNRNKAYILEMAERRRKEEEEVAKTLLERAAKSRLGEGGGDGFLAPTVAYEVQKVSRKEEAVTPLDLEEARLQEEARTEEIAGIRRKFKERHKRILQLLMEKKKEEEQKVELEEAVEREKKERHRKKLDKLTNKRRETVSAEKIVRPTAAAQLGLGPEEPIAKHVVRIKGSSSSLDGDSKRTSVSERSEKGISQGSALKAVRRLSQVPVETSSTRTTTTTKPPNISEDHDNDNDYNDNDEADVKVPDRKRSIASNKQSNSRASEHLSMLSEQRKTQEEEMKKKEERAKRRQVLLSMRVLAEAAERRLMAQEDKYANPEDLNSRVKVKKVLKVTPEMADAMYNRMKAKVQK
eukprot:gene8133-16709_t